VAFLREQCRRNQHPHLNDSRHCVIKREAPLLIPREIYCGSTYDPHCDWLKGDGHPVAVRNPGMEWNSTNTTEILSTKVSYTRRMISVRVEHAYVERQLFSVVQGTLVSQAEGFQERSLGEQGRKIVKTERDSSKTEAATHPNHGMMQFLLNVSLSEPFHTQIAIVLEQYSENDSNPRKSLLLPYPVQYRVQNVVRRAWGLCSVQCAVRTRRKSKKVQYTYSTASTSVSYCCLLSRDDRREMSFEDDWQNGRTKLLFYSQSLLL